MHTQCKTGTLLEREMPGKFFLLFVLLSQTYTGIIRMFPHKNFKTIFAGTLWPVFTTKNVNK